MWVWTLDFFRIFGAQELVSLVHLLKDVLLEKKKRTNGANYNGSEVNVNLASVFSLFCYI